MGKLIAVARRTLTQSNPTPATVTFTIRETDVPAARTNGNAQPDAARQDLPRMHLQREFLADADI